MKKFNEQEAIRLEKIARPIVKADPIAMFASEEDLLIYEHFFINGLEAEHERMAELLELQKTELYWRAHFNTLQQQYDEQTTKYEEKLKQERNNAIDDCIDALCDSEAGQKYYQRIKKELESLKLKSE